MAKFMEPDLSTRMYRVSNGFNESLYLAANEPSLGLYRLQEHVQLTVPRIAEQKQGLQEIHQRVEGACYDMEYDTQTVARLSSITQFSSITEQLKRAVELKRQLDQRRHEPLPGAEHTPSSSVKRDYGTISQVAPPQSLAGAMATGEPLPGGIGAFSINRQPAPPGALLEEDFFSRKSFD